MHRLFSIAIVCLTLLVAQSPARAHRHESLSPEQLTQHLRIYHAGVPASQAPQSWHGHRTGVTLIEVTGDRQAELDLFGVEPASALVSEFSKPAFAATRCDEFDKPPSRRSLFRAFQSLLL